MADLVVAVAPAPSTSPSQSEMSLMNLLRTRVELLTLLAPQQSQDARKASSAETVRVVASALGSVKTLSDGCAIEILRMLEKAPFAEPDMTNSNW